MPQYIQGLRIDPQPVVMGRGTMEAGRILVRERGLDAWLLWVTLAGQVRVTHATGEAVLCAGSVLLYTPQTRQEYGVGDHDGSWTMVWAVFLPRPHWQQLLAWPELAPGIRWLATVDQAAVQALELAERSANGGHPRRREIACCQVETALWEIDAGRTDAGHPAVDPRLIAAQEAMTRDLAHPLGLGSAAAAAGLSPAQFCRLFRRQVGASPLAWRERRRLERAAETLAATGCTVSEAARAVGFQDPFYFSRRFRRLLGLAPEHWRRGMVASQAHPMR